VEAEAGGSRVQRPARPCQKKKKKNLENPQLTYTGIKTKKQKPKPFFLEESKGITKQLFKKINDHLKRSHVLCVKTVELLAPRRKPEIIVQDKKRKTP
jgi:hypothetical protein